MRLSPRGPAVIRGKRGNPVDPLRFQSNRLSIVPTNTRWIAQAWSRDVRREAWAISTPWFTLVIAREPRG